MSREQQKSNTDVAEKPKVKALSIGELKDFLVAHKASISSVASKAMNADRMTRIVIAACTQSPLLAKCDPMTILRGMAKSAELGLECNGGLGEGYLVPFLNKKRGVHEAQFIPGYRGLIALAMRSKHVLKIEAHVVYDTDDRFEFEYGTGAFLRHVPADRTDKSKVLSFYAIAQLKDNVHQFEVMGKREVDKIHASTKKGEFDSPWDTHYDEMGKKTVIRRLFKRLPQSVQMGEALRLDAQIEEDGFLIDEDGVIENLPKRGAAALKEKLQHGGGGGGGDSGGGGAGGGGGGGGGGHIPGVGNNDGDPGPTDKDAPPPKEANKVKNAATLPATKQHLDTIRDQLVKDGISEAELCKAMHRTKLDGITQGEVISVKAWLDDPAKAYAPPKVDGNLGETS